MFKNFSIEDDPHFKIIKFNNSRFFIKKPLKFLRRTQIQYSYRQILSSWLFNGISKPLMDHLAFLETSNEAWAYENKTIWLIYATCLIYTKQNDEALRILHKYSYSYGIKDFAYFLPVANLAFQNNFVSKEIEKANEIFLRFEENQKCNYLEKKIKKAKSIAVVGKAPNQLNKNTGEEIDSHDVVIRVNQHSLKNYIKDYGQKTDIFAGSMSVLWKKRIYMEKNDFLNIFGHSYWNRFFIFHKFNPLQIPSNVPLAFTPVDLTKKFDQYILPHIPVPTTGYITALWIYHILGSFQNVNFYGFSFLNEKEIIYNTYINQKSTLPVNFSDERLFIMHNLAQESINLRKLYYNK